MRSGRHSIRPAQSLHRQTDCRHRRPESAEPVPAFPASDAEVLPATSRHRPVGNDRSSRRQIPPSSVTGRTGDISRSAAHRDRGVLPVLSYRSFHTTASTPSNENRLFLCHRRIRSRCQIVSARDARSDRTDPANKPDQANKPARATDRELVFSIPGTGTRLRPPADTRRFCLLAPATQGEFRSAGPRTVPIIQHAETGRETGDKTQSGLCPPAIGPAKTVPLITIIPRQAATRISTAHFRARNASCSKV